MFKTTLLATVFALGSFAYAGDNGGGTIACASASGRTTVKGEAGAPWNGSGPANLVYTVDGKSLAFNASKPIAPEVHLVDFTTFRPELGYNVEFKRSSLDVISSGPEAGPYIYNEEVFQMRSVGKLKQKSKDVFTFTAVIPAYSSLDPRKASGLNDNSDHFDQDIQLNCTLDVTL